jgi:hypothetical protein
MNGQRQQEPLKKIGRIAFREEGPVWNAYYVLDNTMEGAIFLGAVAIAAARRDEEVKAGFAELMKKIVSGILKAKFGHEPVWSGLEPAPEHERAGKA